MDPSQKASVMEQLFFIGLIVLSTQLLPRTSLSRTRFP